MNAYTVQHFSEAELSSYLETRNAAIQARSRSWNNISAKVIWDQTQGDLSEESINRFNQYVLKNYKNNDRRRPLLFFSNFLNRKPEYEQYARLLTIPKTVKYKGADPIGIDDIRNVINHINQHKFKIEPHRERNTFYCLFYAYSGIRPETATHFSVDDFKEALAREKPYLYVTSKHEPKVKNDYYIPIHPVLIPFLMKEMKRYEANPPKDRKGGLMPFINKNIIQEYLQQHKIPLTKKPSERLEQNHFRKFFQQQSRRNRLDKDYVNFIMNHEQYGLSKESYDTFIEEHDDVYDKYIAAWGPVNLLQGSSSSNDDCPISDVVHSIESMIMEAESVQSIEDILANIDDIISDTSALIDHITRYNQGRNEVDRIKIPPELPSPQSIRLWITSDAANKASREHLTQNQVDAYKRTHALHLFHSYYDQYFDLHNRCLNVGLFVTKIKRDGTTFAG